MLLLMPPPLNLWVAGLPLENQRAGDPALSESFPRRSRSGRKGDDRNETGGSVSPLHNGKPRRRRASKD